MKTTKFTKITGESNRVVATVSPHAITCPVIFVNFVEVVAANYAPPEVR